MKVRHGAFGIKSFTMLVNFNQIKADGTGCVMNVEQVIWNAVER